MSTTIYHLEYPPFSYDSVRILTEEEFWQDLSANHHYETVEVGEGQEFATLADLEAHVRTLNQERRATSWI